MEEGTLDWATSSSSWMPAVHWTDRRRQRGQDTLTETDLMDATCQQQHLVLFGTGPPDVDQVERAAVPSLDRQRTQTVPV